MLQIDLSGCANFSAIGCIGHLPKSIAVPLNPGAILSGSDDFNGYIKLYNSIKYLPPAHPDWGIVTEYTFE